MKKIFLLLLFMAVSLSVYCQTPIKFLGIPVEGSKSAMIAKLQAKGYEYNKELDVLKGEFNGVQSRISVQTVNQKVWRIIISDDNDTDDTDRIKMRYNRLFDQLSSNGKYKIKYGYKIFDSEDFVYNMAQLNKKYTVCFVPQDSRISGYVWYTIFCFCSKYHITMYYENPLNEANGQDL